MTITIVTYLYIIWFMTGFACVLLQNYAMILRFSVLTFWQFYFSNNVLLMRL